MIVDVQCDDHSIQIAKIVKDSGDSCSVKFLERIHSSVFNFSDQVEMIERDSISGFYDVENLEDTGIYVHTQRGMNLSMIVKMKTLHVAMLKVKKVMMCL